MPFFLDGNPTSGEIAEAINYLLGNSQLTTSTNIVNGQITDAVGNVVSYLYKYLDIKYADSFDGSVNFSNTPTNRQYYGLRNNDSSVESTNPADYIWYQVTGGFGTTKQIFYSVTGGRRIDLVVALSAPSPLYQADSGSAIDLDVISGSDGASSRICYAKSTSTSLSSLPSTYQTSGPNSFPPTNTWGGSETWQATPPTLAANEALFQSDGIYNPMTNLTTWNVPYLSNLKVGQLSAISADLGNITAGDISVGSSPAISGTTMTGVGSHLYSNGNFITGNPTTNMVFDGSQLYLNGFSDTYFSSVVSGYVSATPLTVLTFVVQKFGTVIISFSGYIRGDYLKNTTGLSITGGSIVPATLIQITNSVGSSAGFWQPPPVSVAPAYETYTTQEAIVPMQRTVIMNLPADTYTIVAYQNNTQAFTSSKTLATGSGNSDTRTFVYLAANTYQAKI